MGKGYKEKTSLNSVAELTLAAWAEKCRPLGLHYADNLCFAALQALLAGALVDAMLVLKIARLVVGGAVGAVAEGGALMADGFFEHFLHGGLNG